MNDEAQAQAQARAPARAPPTATKGISSNISGPATIAADAGKQSSSLSQTPNNTTTQHHPPKKSTRPSFDLRRFAHFNSYNLKSTNNSPLSSSVEQTSEDMADFQSIAQQFTEFYYKTFDSNRQQLAALYKDHSMLTFENSPVQGAAAITEKLVGLPFSKVQHEVTSLDAQPSNEAGGILVLVSGRLLVDEEQRPMSYTQAFQLLPDGAGSYFVFNDVFRLIYAAA